MAEAIAVGLDVGRPDGKAPGTCAVEVDGMSGSRANLLHFLFLHKKGFTLKAISGLLTTSDISSRLKMAVTGKLLHINIQQQSSFHSITSNFYVNISIKQSYANYAYARKISCLQQIPYNHHIHWRDLYTLLFHNYTTHHTCTYRNHSYVLLWRKFLSTSRSVSHNTYANSFIYTHSLISN